MPTRPVTWDLDVPPKTLLEPAKQPPIGDVPSLNKLRNSLMGTRFELLKISAFAAFLLGFVGVSIHGSHLTNPDNPFVAETSAAFRAMTDTLSNRVIALRDRTEGFVIAMAHTVTGHAANSSVELAKADLHAHGAHANRNGAEQAVQVASIESQHHAHRAHHHHESVDLASADLSSSVQWSGNLIDLPGFVTAKSSEAGHKLVNAVEGNGAPGRGPKARSKTPRMAGSFGSHLEVANSHSLTVRDPSMVAGLLTPDSIVAGMAALLLYMIFVVVLVQIKGGLRALGGNQAAA